MELKCGSCLVLSSGRQKFLVYMKGILNQNINENEIQRTKRIQRPKRKQQYHFKKDPNNGHNSTPWPLQNSEVINLKAALKISHLCST
ncbi:hypothetical protein WN943_028574 [Citrus x changshan-huyou]